MHINKNTDIKQYIVNESSGEFKSFSRFISFYVDDVKKC